MKKILWQKKELVFVLLLTAFVTFFTSAVYLNELIRLPPNHIFVGVTHYWEDFFYYLDQFYQGAHGGWLTVNNFTSELYPAVPFYFGHIILGKIGGILQMQSYETYNISSIVLKFIFIFLSYYLITILQPHSLKNRICIFLIFLFFTSFPNLIQEENRIVTGTFELFRGENTVFSRFNLTPNAYISNILTISIWLIFNRLFAMVFNRNNNSLAKPDKLKILIIALIAAGLLAVTDFAKGLIVIPGVMYILLAFFAQKKRPGFTPEFITIIITVLTYIIIGFWLKFLVGVNPAYDSSIRWDLAQNDYVLTHLLSNPSYLFMAFGVSGILAIIGIFRFLLKEKTILEKLLLVSLITALTGYIIPYWKIVPIPGFRLLFPAVYVFYAVIVFNGILIISDLINRCFPRLTRISMLLIISVYLAINSLTFVPTFFQQFRTVTNSSYVFSYLPMDLYEGIRVLEQLQPKNAVVMANPATEVDHLIPGLTGKTSFTGHILMTINEPHKRSLITRFIGYQLSQDEALNLIKDNRIKYIFYTGYDGNAPGLAANYPFLKIVFQNSFVTIFTI